MCTKSFFQWVKNLHMFNGLVNNNNNKNNNIIIINFPKRVYQRDKKSSISSHLICSNILPLDRDNLVNSPLQGFVPMLVGLAPTPQQNFIFSFLTSCCCFYLRDQTVLKSLKIKLSYSLGFVLSKTNLG